MSPFLGVQATRQAATLALEMQHMRGFVHISTAYVNSNQARGSHVEERIYPLLDGCGARILHCDLAARLTALPAPKAEHLVTRCYSTVSGKLGPAQNGGLAAITSTTSTISSSRDFPVAIVRPTMIGAVAGMPLPGYFGNKAGLTAATLAYATGVLL